MALAAASWSAAATLVFASMWFFWTFVKGRDVVLGFLIAFGLLPLVIMPKLLQFTPQPHFSIATAKIFIVENLIVAFVLPMPAILIAFSTIITTESRFQNLIALAGLDRNRAFREIGMRIAVAHAFPALRAMVPMAILFVLILDWARGGGAGGLGEYTQNVIQSGDFQSRMSLIAALALPSFVVRNALKLYEARMFKEGDIAEIIQGDDQAQWHRREWTKFLVGLLIGFLAILCTWHVLLSSPVIVSSLRYTPARFVVEMTTITTIQLQPHGRVTEIIGDALQNTFFLTLKGTFLGLLTALALSFLAHRSSLMERLFDIISDVIQSVPIVVFIPMYLLILGSVDSVALLLCVSVTYFIGYEIILSRLKATPQSWSHLLFLSKTRDRWRALAREIRNFYGPFLFRLGSAVFVLALPSGLIAALVADLFLQLGGLANVTVYEGNSSILAQIIVVAIVYVVLLFLYVFGRSLEKRI